VGAVVGTNEARFRVWQTRAALPALVAATVVCCLPSRLLADGMAVGPAHFKGVPYKGSVEERSQEAIVIFHGGQKAGEATEDLILRISVVGEVENFAWVIPFPNQPKVKKEDPRLFKELYRYVQARQIRPAAKPQKEPAERLAEPDTAEPPPVEVLSRKIVGSFDAAVVRENRPGALNGWLEKEGYQTLSDADDVLDFYRQKKYVYACIKVSEAQLGGRGTVELHPLRFSFKTGGRDGIFFPMKMTGLQQEPFDVNLYVFYGAWINDHVSKFGYEHRGFRLKYRDWDSPQCERNAGKSYSAPERDAFLAAYANRIPTVTKLFQRLHPGQRYYLTNIQAFELEPEEVREWSDDLWLFPYYVDPQFVPYDARPGGPASTAWPNEAGETQSEGSSQPQAETGPETPQEPEPQGEPSSVAARRPALIGAATAAVAAALTAGVVVVSRRRGRSRKDRSAAQQ